MTNQHKRVFPRLFLFGAALFLFSISSIADTDVYITRDAKGNPVFSDTPTANSEKKVIKELQTVPPEVGTAAVSGSDSKIKELPKYKEIRITSPADDEAVRENSGFLSVILSLEPGLRGNDQIVLYMDGNEVAKGASTSIALSNVDRGTHNLVATVVSADGVELLRSEPVSVHLLRVSVPKKQPKK